VEASIRDERGYGLGFGIPGIWRLSKKAKKTVTSKNKEGQEGTTSIRLLLGQFREVRITYVGQLGRKGT